MAWATAQHFLLGRSWDRISARYGYVLLTDSLHLNRAGAAMAADAVAAFESVKAHVVDIEGSLGDAASGAVATAKADLEAIEARLAGAGNHSKSSSR